MPFPGPLKAVLVYAPSLVKMEPVDLQQFLKESEDIEDFLLLALLGDVWEPLACRLLAVEFRALPDDYTAWDLRQAFANTFERVGSRKAANDDDIRMTHLKILSIGGVCRHFGLQSLAQWLGLLTSDKPSGPVAKQKDERWWSIWARC